MRSQIKFIHTLSLSLWPVKMFPLNSIGSIRLFCPCNSKCVEHVAVNERGRRRHARGMCIVILLLMMAGYSSVHTAVRNSIEFCMQHFGVVRDNKYFCCARVCECASTFSFYFIWFGIHIFLFRWNIITMTACGGKNKMLSCTLSSLLRLLLFSSSLSSIGIICCVYGGNATFYVYLHDIKQREIFEMKILWVYPCNSKYCIEIGTTAPKQLWHWTRHQPEEECFSNALHTHFPFCWNLPICRWKW